MDFTIKNIGPCTIKSPLAGKFTSHESTFVSDSIRINFNPTIIDGMPANTDYTKSFEQAGPRECIYFDPKNVHTAIVTCGGLCPGLNDVIRSIVMESYYRYGIHSIMGIRYGYNGLNPQNDYKPIKLDPSIVRNIHLDGGTMLGSSRGGTEDMEKLVDTLEKMKINILYTIGGDGTLKGAQKIASIALRRGMKLSVVGVPKTIDNDISHIQRSFGFETAFSKAVDSIYAAHVEAEGAPNGIGLVKLMGRNSGFIAANAALAMNDANFVLIPEIPFDMHGKNGFLHHLEKRLQKRGHAVICVAEGAGQDIMSTDETAHGYDPSGNVILEDIGIYLKNAIKKYFKETGLEINLKYIDPSYIIRSAPAVPNDAIFCTLLGQFAVHAAMAGKTDLVIGTWNNIFTHVPIELAISKRKQIDPASRFWFNVIEATGQPENMKN